MPLPKWEASQMCELLHKFETQKEMAYGRIAANWAS